MASQTADYKYVSKSINMENVVLVEYEVSSAVSAAQTLTLTLPAGVSKDLLPIAHRAWSNADPRIPVIAADLLLTSHDRDSGVTVLTAAGGGVPDNATLQVLYVPCGLGT